MLDAALSDLLSSWHAFSSRYSHNRGFPSKAAGTENWRCSRQRDDENGALDTDQEHRIMEIVDFEVSQIPEPGRTGLHVNARALALGLSVFRSPRLLEDQMETLEIISNARAELTRRLVARGVL